MEIRLLILRIKKFYIILNHSFLRKIFFKFWVTAGVEHRCVLNSSISTVVDIGANRGQFALAAKVYTKAKIISFEPLPSAAKTFRQIFHGYPRVKLHNAAIGDSLGKMLIHVSAKDDSSSLLEIGEAQEKFFPGTREIGAIEVEVAPLGFFMNEAEIVSPAILKLDVQGYELQALQGCLSLIHKFDYIYCECSFIELYKKQNLAHHVICFLEKNGFDLSGIYNLAYDGNNICIQGDFLFARRDAISCAS